MRLRSTISIVALSLAALAVAPAAHASFPGSNGKIAFDRGGDIWVMNPDGSNQVNLTNDAANQSNPAWSADGTRIAFQETSGCCQGKTYWMLADGSNRVLADNGDPALAIRVDPVWSPSGNEIAFSNGTALFRMAPDGTPTSSAIAGPGGVYDPDWSGDGQFIAVEENQGKFCDFRHDLVVIRPNGTDQRAITSYPCDSIFTVFGSSISPDSQRVAFYQGDGCIVDPCSSPDYGLWTAKLDGTDKQKISNQGGDPAWSPDGTKIVFGAIGVMNADGSNVTTIASGLHPDWQPIPPAPGSVDVLANLTDSPDPVKGGAELHYTAQAKNLVNPVTATGVTLTLNLPAGFFFVSATPTQGSCSHSSAVVTCSFGTLPPGATASVDVLVEAFNVSAPTSATASASVSANEPDPVVGNNTDSESTQVTFGAYPRPKSATPTLAPLVIAYKVCGSGEATEVHASPLNYPSCANPQQTSGFLTAGTPDANAHPANFVGQVKLRAIGEPPPINPNNGDQSDVGLDTSLTDVRNKSDLTPYNGGLLVNIPLQITDHDSGAGGFTSATVVPTDISFAVPCSSGTCSLSSTYEAVVPGAVKELKRANWELGAVRVLDGGADGNPATAPNTVFAVQGVFVP